MKNSFVLFFLLFFSTISKSQERYYGVIGYGAAFKTFNNAYANYTKGSFPTDLTTLDYYNDRMLYSNWHIKMGAVGDWYLLDADITTAISAISLVIYQAIADKNVKPQNFPGVGRLKKIDDNTAQEATAYGYDTNFGSLEFAVGDGGWLVGAYTGFSAYGTGGYSGTNPTLVDEKQIYPAFSRDALGNLGLTFHRVFGDDEQMAVLSMRANRIILRSEDTYSGEKIRRRGLELYPSARLFFGDSYGLYVEAFYKFQRFGTFTPSTNTNVILPSTTSHVFGINLGLFMPYS